MNSSCCAIDLHSINTVLSLSRPLASLRMQSRLKRFVCCDGSCYVAPPCDVAAYRSVLLVRSRCSRVMSATRHEMTQDYSAEKHGIIKT